MHRKLQVVTAAVVLAASAVAVRADEVYEQEPIRYTTAAANDPVARLQSRIDRGEAKLTYDPKTGYLASLLEQLKVPVASQTLVFSKTSFQRDRISPSHPRALYFDDDTYVGYVHGGDVIELASTDPNLGTVFYTLDQRKPRDPQATTQPRKPHFFRQTHNCLQCHGSSMTRDVPGLLLRSIYPDAEGQPVLSAGTFLTTQQSPWAERWGGWYVTGHHGKQRHMGNAMVKDDADGATAQPVLDTEAGANVTDLSGKFDTSAYLATTSDVVPLMVFAHQAQMHNLLTRANYQTRLALRDEQAMDEALGRQGGTHAESTLSRIKDAGEPLVRYMLFCDEAALGKVQGDGKFDEAFEARGPRDAKGRSLRDLDLKRRLFKYPLSYLIYSAQFDALPEPVKEYVYQRLWDVLSGKDTTGDFSHINSSTRQAIVEILRETKEGLPGYWK